MRKVIIHSVPRSGSTWLGQIFNSHPDVIYKYQPLFSYAFKDYLNSNSSKDRINDFFNEIAKSDDNFINQKEAIDKGIIPTFNKKIKPTHICYKEVRYHHVLENLLRQCDDVKVILLIRNPLAVLYSWKNAPKEFKKELGWNFEEEWLEAPSKNLHKPEEYNGFNKWKEATNIFLNLKKQYPNNVKLIKYSDLLKNTQKVVNELFIFSNLDLSIQSEMFLKESKSKNVKDAYSVFKIKKKDTHWHKLPKHMIEYVQKDLLHTSLNIFLND